MFYDDGTMEYTEQQQFQTSESAKSIYRIVSDCLNQLWNVKQ